MVLPTTTFPKVNYIQCKTPVTVRKYYTVALKAGSPGSQKQPRMEQGLKTVERERKLHLNSIISVSQSVLQDTVYYS